MSQTGDTSTADAPKGSVKAHAPHENRLRHPAANALPDLGSTTATRSWVALGAIVLVMLAALAWGVFGQITVQTSVGAQAAGGGVIYEVTAPVSGVVSAIAPSGRVLGKGIPLAQIMPENGGAAVSVGEEKAVMVSSWNVVLGSPVKVGDVMAHGVVFNVAPARAGVATTKPVAAMTYVPMDMVGTIQSALALQLVVRQNDGELKVFPATFISADSAPSSEERIALVTGNPTFAEKVTQQNGGETFAVYLGYANPDDAQSVADGLRTGRMPLITTGSAATLTITEVQSNPIRFLFSQGS